jgi:ankyrin repeat protein
MLITLGANPDMRLSDGMTPLMLAAQYANPDMIRFILAKNADPNIQNDNGLTALIYAVMSRCEIKYKLEVVRLLLVAGANIDLQARQGSTALMLTFYSPSESSYEGPINELASLLLSFDPNLTLKDIFGRTALIEAAKAGYTEAVRLMIQSHKMQDAMLDSALMKLPSDVIRHCITPFLRSPDQDFIDIQDNDGRTALMYASYHGYVDIVRLLVEAGAHTELVDNNSHTASYLATHNQDLSISRQAQVLYILHTGQSAQEQQPQHSRVCAVPNVCNPQ